MVRIVAIANQKGGVGKTTTSVNLSAAIALQGKSVLLIDLDPQGNATSGVGIDTRSLQKSVYNCLIKQDNCEIVIQKTSIDGLAILPSNANLAGAEIELVNVDGREHHLRDAIKDVQNKYDVIILDCPPALGILTINALAAAKSVLIPVQCEYYAMEGLSRLLDSIKRVQQSINLALSIEGIVLTMYDARNTLARQVSEQVRSHFGDKVYQSVIPRNVTLAEAPSYGRPGILYNAASSGSQAYLALAKEFIDHGEKSTR
ncbi:MAG: AAA family ATPase [Nitrospira sp.]